MRTTERAGKFFVMAVKTSFQTFFACVLAVAFLSACADKFVLSGTPEFAGLLVVEPEINARSFLGEETQRSAVQVTIRKVVGDVLLEGELLEGRFVFQGLKPGKYELVSVSIQPGKKPVAISVPSEDEEQFAFEIAAGIPLYMGVLRIQQDLRMKELGTRFQLIPDPDRERAAWRSILKHLNKSQWKPVIEQRLKAL